MSALSSLLALAGCGPDSKAADGDGNPVRVLTSTGVYADIVRSIGGNAVEVDALIPSDGGADPHSYETTARDVLAVKRAGLVIANGGGYDDFLTQALEAAGGERTVLTAVTEAHHEDEGAAALASGPAPHDHGAGSNEHVWYDLKAMATLATAIADALGHVRPAEQATFTSGADTFKARLAGLMTRQAAIREAHGGMAVAVTEPLPLHLLADSGLVDNTPSGFSEAIEEGTDVPARVLQATLDLFANHAVDLLVYNSQTTGPQTERVQDAARKAGVPVVAMSETLPPGQDYVSWMRANLDAIAKALA
ncbi:MAG TPA: zinc ABC transporter substrate-binding protein [Sporichthya sp.]|nr:zinc ABC transporter substrate-binding protein [Sporichthya sp.]